MQGSQNHGEYLPHAVNREDRGDNTILLTSPRALGPVARNTGEWLHRWAEEAPQRVFIAERWGAGWREVSYQQALEMVRAIAASLLGRGLGPERPVVVLSGNSVDHGLIALAAQYAGIPVVPVAEQYSLIPGAHDRLRHVIEMTRPGLVHVGDAERYGDALSLDALAGIEVASSRPGTRKGVTDFAELLKGDAGAGLDAIHADVGPETLAKILFTSGSTSMPKGVMTTHGMMCVNQAQIGGCFPFLSAHPPKIVDWLPWNHVFGGSHNFNLMLSNGGSIYIDDGKPTRDGFARSLENLAMHAGSIAFNVPLAYGMLVQAFEKDAALRGRYFADLDMIFYSGASLPQEIWQALERYALAETGRKPLMTSSWGMTETAPATLMVHEPVTRSGLVGVPMPGITVKLIGLDEGLFELRVKGPNVMKGYFRDREKSAEAFDGEGYLITGDAVRLADSSRLEAGLSFDGRISEDFKLLSGTWVHAAQIRLGAMGALAPLVQDIVVTGHDKRDIGILIFPDKAQLAQAGLDGEETDGCLAGAALRSEIGKRLEHLAKSSTGSSTRVARAIILASPPSLEHHEVTSKGNLNNRKVLEGRADLVARLYDDNDLAIIRI
ncbi:MAG: feruloyl-CoA synthase [Nitratireductor sp.]|nr:feruloyl-CoA synthase [Nitratireductor sp.]